MTTPFRVWAIHTIDNFGHVAADHGDKIHVDIPCGDCTACCYLDVGVSKGDLQREPRLAAHLQSREERGNRAANDAEHYIVQQADGACHFLIDGKCSIYATRPSMCRLYDCRIEAAFDIGPAVPSPRPVDMATRASGWTRLWADIESPLPEHEAAYQQAFETAWAIAEDEQRAKGVSISAHLFGQIALTRFLQLRAAKGDAVAGESLRRFKATAQRSRRAA